MQWSGSQNRDLRHSEFVRACAPARLVVRAGTISNASPLHLKQG